MLMKQDQQQQQFQQQQAAGMLAAQRVAAGDINHNQTAFTGSQKLHRLNSAGAGLRDRKLHDNDEQQQQRQQQMRPQAAGHHGQTMHTNQLPSSSSTNMAARASSKGVDAINQEDSAAGNNNNNMYYQNQQYQVSGSSGKQGGGARNREQRVSASAGRGDAAGGAHGGGTQKERNLAQGHQVQGGAPSSGGGVGQQEHYTMRFGQLGQFGQQVAAGHLSGRSAGQANKRANAMGMDQQQLSNNISMRPPVIQQYGSASNLKFGDRRASANPSSGNGSGGPAYGSLFTAQGSNSNPNTAYNQTGSHQKKQDQLSRGQNVGHNTFYNTGYNTKGHQGGGPSTAASGGQAAHGSTSEHRSNSVKVTAANRLGRDVTSGLSPQKSFHDKFNANGQVHQQQTSAMYHKQQSHQGISNQGAAGRASHYNSQQQIQQQQLNSGVNYQQQTPQLNMYKSQTSVNFQQRQASLQKTSGQTQIAQMGSPKLNNLLPPSSDRASELRESKQHHPAQNSTYNQVGVSGAHHGGRVVTNHMKTPKSRQKPQLAQPINTEGKSAPYDFYRTTSGASSSGTGGFLPHQGPNTTKAVSGYSQNIQSGRSAFPTSNSQTRGHDSGQLVGGQSHQHGSAQKPPTANGMYSGPGSNSRHSMKKQMGTRGDSKMNQTTSYQRSHLNDGSHQGQLHHQTKDLRKMRDESTQGSRSRAPNFSLYQNNQGNQYSGMGQQVHQQQIGVGRTGQREERGRSNQHTLANQQPRSKYTHGSHSQGRNTTSSVPSLLGPGNSSADHSRDTASIMNSNHPHHQNQTGNPHRNFGQNNSKDQNAGGRMLNNSSTLSSSTGPQGSMNQTMSMKRQRSQQFRSAQGSHGSQGPLLPPSGLPSQAPQMDNESKKQFSSTMQGLTFDSLDLPTNNDESQALSQQHHYSHPQFIGQTGLDVQTLFKQNSNLITKQIKVDPATGLQQKIQQLTTLDIKKMIHEVSADEESEDQKLALQPGARIIIPNKEPTKCSIKRNGIVRAYAAITNQGLVRTYNEDRVSIILNITKPAHRKEEVWPKCSFFGVYDGHGGHNCAEFLRDQLHHFVVKQDCFPQDPREAIVRGFRKAEETFIQMCQGRDENGNAIVVDRSGSCAIVILIVGDICYSANVGDSRATISINGGQIVMPLSRDHKPSDTNEYARIIQNGGQVYQTTTAQSLEPDPSTIKGKGKNQSSKELGGNNADSKGIKWSEPEYVIGPIRVLPGRLSVSRTFGDPEAKLAYRGGNMNVVKAEPEIRQFQIHKNHDFIILASDGVFDKMSNEDVSKCVWESCDKNKWQANPNFRPAQSVHQQCGLAVESVLKNSLYRQSLDNVTVVMIAFQNFKRKVFGQGKNSDRDDHNQLGQNAETQSSTKPESSKKTESILASDKPSSSNAAKSSAASFHNHDQLSQPTPSSGKPYSTPQQIQSSKGGTISDIQQSKAPQQFNNTTTSFGFQKRSNPMHTSQQHLQHSTKSSSLSRPSTQQTQNQRFDQSKLHSRGSMGTLPSSSLLVSQSLKQKDNMQQHHSQQQKQQQRPPQSHAVTRTSAANSQQQSGAPGNTSGNMLLSGGTPSHSHHSSTIAANSSGIVSSQQHAAHKS